MKHSLIHIGLSLSPKLLGHRMISCCFNTLLPVKLNDNKLIFYKVIKTRMELQYLQAWHCQLKKCKYIKCILFHNVKFEPCSYNIIFVWMKSCYFNIFIGLWFNTLNMFRCH